MPQGHPSQSEVARDKDYLTPVRVVLIVLVVAFAIESVIMLVLPACSRFARGDASVSFIDSAILVSLLTPVLWLLVVRPLRRSVAERGQLLSRTIEVQDHERTHLARELHDELGQTQTAILLGLKAVTTARSIDEARERAEELHELAVLAVDSTRRIARGLAPGVLLDFGLEEALKRMCEDLSAATAIRVHCETDLGDARFDAAAETAVYRVAQEAITNALKHSGASNVQVNVTHSGGRLALTVTDDGSGICERVGKHPNCAACGLGLGGMRERAILLGGWFSIASGKSGGTQVEATIPAEAVTP